MSTEMARLLREHGIRTNGPHTPAWVLETGHHVAVYPGHMMTGIRTGQPWDDDHHMMAYHPGDPTGTWLWSNLGPDMHQVPDRLNREFRNRETMGHLSDMYQRARVNNDPTGTHPEARRVRDSGEGDLSFIHLNHYE